MRKKSMKRILCWLLAIALVSGLLPTAAAENQAVVQAAVPAPAAGTQTAPESAGQSAPESAGQSAPESAGQSAPESAGQSAPEKMCIRDSRASRRPAKAAPD